MAIDDEIMMNRRGFLNKMGVLLGYSIIASQAGCLLDTRGLASSDGSVGRVDASTDPTTDIDPQETDGGTPDGGDACAYNNEDIPLMLFTVLRYDPSKEDSQQNMEDQRVYEGGLTLAELFDAALNRATAYSAAGFKSRYDATPGVMAAMQSDIGSKLEELTCGTGRVDAFVNQLFDDGTGAYSFRLRDTNAIYFARAEGNDGTERTYMLMVGGIVPRDGDQPADPVVLYFTPMDNTTTLLESIEQEGI
ncbi:hypothetical protein JW898_00725 [Candidatus Woesearchaeota archaeon]|nr:hypothetical protein [Candidatus Woesearchaeota archaeon]